VVWSGRLKVPLRDLVRHAVGSDLTGGSTEAA
jgi:hypothetical protein